MNATGHSKDAPDKKFSRTIVGLMFLDVKGYSGLQEKQLQTFSATVMPQLAQAAEIEKHDYVNTWGDAIVLASSDIRLLVRSAAAIRDVLRSFDWSEHNLPEMEARISLHTGSIYKGEDAFSNRGMIVGSAITLAARIGPMVMPGEMWATNDFITAFAREQQNMFQWHSLGLKKLAKDAGEEELFVIYRMKEQNPAHRQVAGVIVVQKERQVLLVRRVDSSKPTWQFPAAQVKLNADPKLAAIKECRKETGVTCAEARLIGERLHPQTGVYVHYFHAQWTEGEPVNGDPTENDAVEWVSPGDAISRFTTDLDPRVKEVLDQIGRHGS